MAEEMAENEAPVNHEDVSILIDRPPPMPVADHFLDGAQGMRDNCFAVKSNGAYHPVASLFTTLSPGTLVVYLPLMTTNRCTDYFLADKTESGSQIQTW